MSGGKLSSDKGKAAIAYLTMGFPVRSETAVVREIYALRGDFDVHVFSVRPLTFGEGIYEPKADLYQGQALGFTPKLALKGVRATLKRGLKGDKAFFSLLGETLRGGGAQLPKALVVLCLSTAFADEAQAKNIRYIHGNFASFQAYGAYAIHRLTGIPFGFTMHAHDLFIHGFMMDEKVKEADVVVSISEFNRQYIKEKWGLSPEGIEIVHCGIDLSEFSPSPQVKRQEGAPLKMLSVGRLTAMKGFTYMLSALGQLHDVPFEYDLVGAGEDEAMLREKAKALGLGDRVRFHTQCPQETLKALYQGANLYVQPSIRLDNGLMEGVPATLMEAMATALPCISTRLSGVPELVRHNVSGLLIEPQSPRQLADAIRWMYAHPEEAATMGSAGRAIVEEEFDATKNATALGELITQTLASKDNEASR